MRWRWRPCRDAGGSGAAISGAILYADAGGRCAAIAGSAGTHEAAAAPSAPFAAATSDGGFQSLPAAAVRPAATIWPARDVHRSTHPRHGPPAQRFTWAYSPGAAASLAAASGAAFAESPGCLAQRAKRGLSEPNRPTSPATADGRPRCPKRPCHRSLCPSWRRRALQLLCP